MKHIGNPGFFKSIFLKFTLAFIAAGLIPLLFFSYITLGKFSKSIEDYTVSTLEQIVVYTVKSVDKTISDYNNILKLIYSYNVDDGGNLRINDYSGLARIIKNADVNGMPEDSPNKGNETLMEDFTKQILYTNSYIKNVFFIDFNSRMYYSSRETKLYDAKYNFVSRERLDPIHKNKNNLTILPTHRESYFVKSEQQVVTFARNYLDLEGQIGSEKILGTLFIDVSIDAFDEIFKRINLGDNGEIYLLDSAGNCVYSNKKESITKKINWFPNTNEFKESNRSSFMSSDGVYNIFFKTQMGDWTVVSRINRKDISKKIDDIRNFILLVIVACISALIMVALAFSKGLSLPIQKIRRQMKKIESGDLNVQVEVKSRDEIGQLAISFNNMAVELKSHINKAYISQIKQRDAELTALKAQIRPHFLYNTLEVIRMSAVESGDERVADMIHSLSAQLRYIIGYNDDMIILSKEVKMIANYFKLISIRYEERINLELKIPDNCMKLQILKLSLQPIVENAIFHGIKPKNGCGKVLIMAEIAGDDLEISVFDDGVGMETPMLDKLRTLLTGDKIGEQTPDGWRSVGIKNVHDRLRMNFGEKYGLEISSQQRVGTVVKLKMPVLEGGSSQNDQSVVG